jgi:hypothetical protein
MPEMRIDRALAGGVGIMTPEQILLVQTSFAMTGTDGATLARCLHRRLAARGTNPDIPAARLARGLVHAVRRASRPAACRRLVRRLGTPPPALRDRNVLIEAVGDALGAPLPPAAADAWRAWHRLALGRGPGSDGRQAARPAAAG